LNERGTPTTLLRLGRDFCELPEELARAASPQVLALGRIAHHEHVGAVLALADYFVQPGEAGAFNDYRFPSKLPEFFALGRPVILPRTNLGRLLRHGVDAYVVERADAASIAEAVLCLRRDLELAGRLAAGAAQFAAERFSWRRSAEDLQTFYDSLFS
jgi:glycosyltransferase involved in cell wall biosynthesis